MALRRPDSYQLEIADKIDMYANSTELFNPEKIVLEHIKPKLKNMRMLDIGVGPGRTTQHFAEFAREYVGIDFDRRMLERCNLKFFATPSHFSLLHGDARSLCFKDNSFDFTMFSFNGLDYLSHGDRLKAFAEIKRVNRPGAYFFFSTHNINSIDGLFAASKSAISLARFVRSPKTVLNALLHDSILRIRNGNFEKIKTANYAVIYDGSYNPKFSWLLLSLWNRLGFYYHSKPEEQVRQLTENGFQIISIYALDGREIKDPEELRTKRDYCLHYLCEIVK